MQVAKLGTLLLPFLYFWFLRCVSQTHRFFDFSLYDLPSPSYSAVFLSPQVMFSLSRTKLLHVPIMHLSWHSLYSGLLKPCNQWRVFKSHSSWLKRFEHSRVSRYQNTRLRLPNHEASGISPGSVDDIMLTHAHSHLLPAFKAIETEHVFSRAELFVPKDGDEFWTTVYVVTTKLHGLPASLSRESSQFHWTVWNELCDIA